VRREFLLDQALRESNNGVAPRRKRAAATRGASLVYEASRGIKPRQRWVCAAGLAHRWKALMRGNNAYLRARGISVSRLANSVNADHN
jgi:hypothetical protein